MEDKKQVKINGTQISIEEVADQAGIKSTEIIKFFFTKGIPLSINSYLDLEKAEEFCVANEIELEMVDRELDKEVEHAILNENDTSPRAPIITIMGHVDHGKTSILDFIRKTKVTDGEAGGITQSIGAYQVKHNKKPITFIDTPGHELFSHMRARGAGITDVIIIVIAGDDSVMKQTIESIDHAKASKKPIIIAVNKMDLPAFDLEKVKADISAHDIVPEDWGGDVPFVSVSAHTGEGIDKLLETILTVVELSDLQAPTEGIATGVVIESHLEKGKGSVATLLVRQGTLKKDDFISIEGISGKVKTLVSPTGEHIKEAVPSTPVQISGLSQPPHPGSLFRTFDSPKEAKKYSEQYSHEQKKEQIRTKLNETVSSNDEREEFHIILKADTKGSVEAIKQRLLSLENEDARLKLIRSEVGDISISDLTLAQSTNSSIYTFNILPSNSVKQQADNLGVSINSFNIVYKLFEEVEATLKGALKKIEHEEIKGEAEIRKIFKFSKIGKIAGSMVTSGKISRTDKVRVLRDGKLIYDSTFSSLKTEKQDVGSVSSGHECGFTVDKFQDIKVGDVIQAYTITLLDKE